MDVMKPELVWVEGGCYRFFDSHVWSSQNVYESHSETLPAQDGKREVAEPTQTFKRETEDPSVIPERDRSAPCEETNKPSVMIRRVFEIEGVSHIKMKRDARGKVHHQFYVALKYYPFILDSKTKTKQEIEWDTRTSIHVPNQYHDDFAITAIRRSYIDRAIVRLNDVIAKARSTLDPTHFLSIPMTDETIKANLANFRDAVLNEYNDNSQFMNKAAFIEPEKLHLNLGMLLMVDEKEKKAAFETLAQWKETIMMPIIEKNGPVKIKVEGLDWAQASQSAYMIFGKVSSENNTLEELVRQTTQLFAEKGLMHRAENRMHHRSRMDLLCIPTIVDRGTDFQATTESIASKIVSAHKDHFFGEIELSVLHLSCCRKYDDNGYYAIEAKIEV